MNMRMTSQEIDKPLNYIFMVLYAALLIGVPLEVFWFPGGVIQRTEQIFWFVANEVCMATGLIMTLRNHHRLFRRQRH